MLQSRRWPLKRSASKKSKTIDVDHKGKATLAEGFMGLFRRNVASNAGYVQADTDYSGLRRRATDQQHAVSSTVHSSTSRAVAAAMARSRSGEVADSTHVNTLPVRPSHARHASQSPHALHRRRRDERARSGEVQHGEEQRWGPPPARHHAGEPSATAPLTRKPATSLTESSQAQEFGHVSRDSLSPLMNAESSLRRNKTFSARTPHARATQSVYLSPSITSTARARATCPTPSVEELSKRSSQFVGFWNPAPLHDLVAFSYGTPPPYSCLPGEPVLHQQLVDDEMERLNDLHLDITSAVKSPSTSASHASDSPITPVGLGPAPPRSPSRKASNDASSNGRSTWAVARGWRTGLYPSYDEAHVQINGFPGPLIRQFDSHHEASEWLASGAAMAQRIPSLRTLDIDEDVSILAKGKPDIDDRDGAIDNLIRRSSSLRRTHVPAYRARA